MDEPSILDWLKENISSPSTIFAALRSSLQSEEGEERKLGGGKFQEPTIDLPEPDVTSPEPTSAQAPEEVTREPEPVPAAEDELTESHARDSLGPEDTPPSPPEPATNRPLESDERPESRSGRVAEVQLSIQVPIGSRVNLTVDAVRREHGEASIEISEKHDREEATEVRILSTQSQAAQVPRSPSNAHRIQTPALGERISLPAIPFGDVWARVKEGLRALGFPITLGTSLFALGGIIYLATRLASLDQFPIYFFADEAYQVVFADRLIDNNFLAPNQYGIPIYIESSGFRWTPMISTYIYAVMTLLVGKSIIITRATSAVVSLLGVISASLILKHIFHRRYWWIAIIFLATVPAWFLHTRTAFETVMTSAFYATFLYFYLRYRVDQPKFLFPALLFGALAFYSYSIGQAIMGLAALLLLVSDLRYHWENRDTILRAIPILIILAIPLVIFRIKQPSGLEEHLRAVDSYWFQDVSLGTKLTLFVRRYLSGLSPLYWFFPHSKDLIRHRMVGYAHMPIWSLPFGLIGLITSTRNIRESRYRTLILATLAVPFGAAMLDVIITRVLTLIIPASIVICLGLDWAFHQAEQRVSRQVISIGSFALLVIASILMTRTALVNGPLWSNEYGLYGMQYGAKQLFAEAIPEYWSREPDARFHVSSTWSNGTNHFLDFFFSGEARDRVQISGIDSYLNERHEIVENEIFVLTPSEYQVATESNKLKELDVQRIINYPDGNPGFYFVKLEYVDNIEEILEAERRERQKPIQGEVEIDGQTVEVSYSRNDMGQLSDMFDDDYFTLLRGLEANPYLLEFTFPEPRPMSGMTGLFAVMDYTISVDLYSELGSDPVQYELTQMNVQDEPEIEIQFDDGPPLVKKAVIRIEHLLAGNTAHIHIRELDFLP